MNRKRVLVIEDDGAVRRGITDALGSEGYVVIEAADGHDGLAAALGGAYDLLLLDLVLPGPDGFAILGALRKARPAVPVVILTALGEEDDRVRGLRLGADDYVVKPFSVRELLARVDAVLRRAGGAVGDPLRVRFPDGEADLEARSLSFKDGRTAELSARECDLLRYFAARAGQPVSREELLARVWGLSAPGIETRTVDMHIARLREKLRDDAASPRVILTERGRGYIFNGEAAP